MNAQVFVCTIGYQGKSIQEIVAELVEAEIAVICDVRRRALSRKKGFSKKGLSAHLNDAGIAYVHYPALGMPTDLLELRNERDNEPILREYRARLYQLDDLVANLAAQARDEKLCLLCFESDHAQCHRGILAQKLHESFELSFKHL